MAMSGTRFKYRAARGDGRVESGTVHASDERAAWGELAGKGLFPLQIRPAPPFLPERRIGSHEVAIVFRNAAILVGSGVPIERALAVSEPLVSGRLAIVLADVRRLIREGSAVAAALEAWPSVFPRSVMGMIRAGERGSSLTDACRSAAEHLEASTEIQTRVRAALAYPALILLVGLATVVVMGTVVVPRFVTVLNDLGAELPPATQILLVVSSLSRDYGIVVLAALAIAVPVVLMWLRGPEVRAKVDRLLLRTPLVGRIRLGFASGRTCAALGGMLHAGMPLLAALDAAEDATGDMEVSRRLSLARDAVARGAGLSETLGAIGVLSPVAVQLVGVGEASGRLAPMMTRAGALAGEEAERTLRTAVALIEPLLVVVLGVIVASIAAALLQAVYSVRPPV